MSQPVQALLYLTVGAVFGLLVRDRFLRSQESAGNEFAMRIHREKHPLVFWAYTVIFAIFAACSVSYGLFLFFLMLSAQV
jgi:hypothetical protein